ncbi:nitrate reductase [Ketobacter sp.]|uniref:nitrate reductase n=1 Tax=Ketobacter sp. TaxID=2083498 RepID=UPI000F184E0B|nr:nitrate reductase [Ketobacter sp.]RLT94766.1 MAG: nitrate reductase [Ketobacter sp.]
MVNRSTCAYCGVGCGIEIHTNSDGSTSVKGDFEHPANFGKLCSKGSSLAHTLTGEGRLLHPKIHGLRASWEQATHYVASEFTRIIDEHGPQAVAFYVSGQLLTEDYYVANKLMKGFIGSANIDTNSRLCMSSAVAAYKRAFGEDSVPASYEDLEIADLIVLTGSNTAWCHPILFQRIKSAKAARPQMKVVVIDPRRTATCEIADLHLAIKPGTDVALFNGLLNHLQASGKTDAQYIQQHCEGFEAAMASARQAGDIQQVATLCDLPASDVAEFYQWFADTERTLTCFSQGINQSSQGTDKGNAIINCHLATGRVGKPGASPFSLTGQPNAMGGREVGGLANQLAAHMEFNPQDLKQVSEFWQAPNIARTPGLKAVDLFDAVAAGTVKAVWVMGTNPAVSLPNAGKVVQALQQAELLVVSDCIETTDTSTYAQVLLPAAGWGEKDGTVTNSERRISRQKGALEPLGEARQDWRILTDVAAAMGFAEHFPYTTAADVFREHARLTRLNRHSPRKLDLGNLAELSEQQYDELAPVQWPVLDNMDSQRLYGDGHFSTDSGKARFVAVAYSGVSHPVSPDWPLALNTGRIRDQWHTMTRTALAPPLNAHKPEPFVEIHPDTAADMGLEDQKLARIQSPWGSAILRVNVTDSLRRGELFVPMHWNDQWARGARIGELVNPAVDPISGQPESKHTPCRIEPWHPQWSAVMLSRDNLPIPDCDYAAKIRGKHFYRYELAGDATATDLTAQAQQFADTDAEPSVLYQDPRQPAMRSAWLDAGGLRTCIYIGPGNSGIIANADRNWLSGLFGKPELDAIERKALLSGKSPAGVEDCGRTICACFGVGEKTILKAIREHRLTDAAAVGKLLKAGTNCGSCVSEIKGLLAAN